MVKDGYKFAAGPLLLGIVALVVHWNYLSAVLIALGIFVLFFFRDPNRTPPADPNVIVSPADGRIMVVVEEPRGGRPGTRISIFLSVFNVHVNRSPVAGTISSVTYNTGRFYAAMRGRASLENERNVIEVASDRGEIVFTQIAGWVARRILCWKKVGDSVTRGERVGMIRFGSRVDIWLPSGVEVEVRRGQNVAGGSSTLARWR